MDTNEELDKMCRGLEIRLASMAGDQEREYDIINSDGVIVGSVKIPVDADEDQIIEILNSETELLDADIEYNADNDGKEDVITISSDNESGISMLRYELKTYEDIENFEEFMENVLDIERTQYLSDGGWHTRDYTVVVGTGGPHIEFTTDYHIHAYWGSGRIDYCVSDDDARSTMDRVEDYLNDLYYEMNHGGR